MSKKKVYSKNYRLNDFEQKVRNRPIQITDIAIDKSEKQGLMGLQLGKKNLFKKDIKKY